tara:strand:- start:74 stop:409 length:336 start_codon:yes stop_codon:yes gene_type:complete
VGDWAANGNASNFLFGPDEAKKRVPAMTNDVALAHAKFQLGQYLGRNGCIEEADAIFAECSKLHPDSWNIYRETAEWNERGLAAGEGFWEKVGSLVEKQYCITIDMEGMPG